MVDRALMEEQLYEEGFGGQILIGECEHQSHGRILLELFAQR